MPDMDRLIIRGGNRLHGDVRVSGGKNAALAVIPATLLTDEICVIENLPYIDDVYILGNILELLGAKVDMPGSGRMVIDPSGVNKSAIPDDLSKRLRASYYLMSALLGRCGMADVPFPGGCMIGSRPIDQTVKGLSALGATVSNRGGVLVARAPKLKGNEVYFDVSSVGATVNTMLAAVLADGQTTIIGAAKEPHIVDCANFLNSMGASIKGAGTDTIRVRGVKKLHGTEYTIIPDQIEAGTLMVAAAATRGDVSIRNIIPIHMEAITAKLCEAGASVVEDGDCLRVRGDQCDRFKAVNIKTMPYPGFPTDLQQVMAVLLSIANGTSIVTETIYESRFKYVEEIRLMGASVRIIDRVLLMEGVEKLYGARVIASDLRASAALVVAGLIAEGETTIEGVYHIDRGYEGIVEKLTSLGAEIERISE